MPTELQKAAAARRAARERFLKARLEERSYMARLSAIGRQVGEIVKGFERDGKITDPASLIATMEKYSEIIEPWAQSVGERMVANVADRDYTAWKRLSKSLGTNLEREILSAPTGTLMRELMARQVHYIKSIPLDAAKRVHELTIEARISGRRAEDVARDIRRSTHVSISKAQLIARTEVARTASKLTESRAIHIGSDGYFWRTVRDTDVRSAHKALDGTLVPWNAPPIASEPGQKVMRYHAGQGPNCRCYPEPNIPWL
jgi:SPP1 gp7 family putative phage head morphogenesis protein